MRYRFRMNADGTREGGKDREGLRAGLCSRCLHARRIESARGSEFLLCERSATDPAFPKYPRLPVVECPGYTRKS
jgi:hypothetical protein